MSPFGKKKDANNDTMITDKFDADDEGEAEGGKPTPWYVKMSRPSASFKRRTGPAVDVQELEYVMALHQACLFPRENGSISATDISHFLMSRYGLRVDPAEVTETVMDTFGGSTDENERFDLVEVVATLLIPYLRAASSWGDEDIGDCLFRRNVSVGENGDQMTVVGVVEEVSKMILRDVTGSSEEDVPMTATLMKKILRTYGEEEMAEDDTLVWDMVRVAKGGSGAKMFDGEAFARALTSDLDAYNIADEMSFTTNYADVFEKPGDSHATARTDVESPRSAEPPPQRVKFSSDGIDYIADTFRSKIFVVLLWAFFIMTGWTHFSDFVDIQGVVSCEATSNTGIVGCRIMEWFILVLVYCIGGTVFIGLGSLGNSLDLNWVWPQIISIISVAAFTVIPFMLSGQSPQWSAEEATRLQAASRVITVLLGAVLLVLQIFYLIAKKCQKKVAGKTNALAKFFLTLHSGNVIAESQAKKAAVFKTKKLVENALKVHVDMEEIDSTRDKCFVHALMNYDANKGESSEWCGGFLWLWKQIASGKLLEEEGIWVPTMIMASNLLQLILSVIFVTVGFHMTAYLQQLVKDAGDDFVTAVQATVQKAGETAGAGEVVNDVDAVAQLSQSQVDEVYAAVGLGGTVASCLALAVCLIITCDYLPNTVKTMILFRSGEIPFANKKANFLKYKVAPDTVSKVAGGMFWSVFFAGVATYLIYGIVVFCAIWQPTQNLMISIGARLLGGIFTLLIRLIFLCVFRKVYYAGLYRTELTKANFMLLALQCLDFAQSFWFMIVRAIIFIVYAGFYTGRVDMPFFAPEVGSYGAFDIDGMPTIYRRMLVAHESHRHPFIESLGKIYLLKLRHKDSFGTDSFGTMAGSRWRLLFVSALFPWLRHYRVAMDEDADYAPQMMSGRWSKVSSRRLTAIQEGPTSDTQRETVLRRSNSAAERRRQSAAHKQQTPAVLASDSNDAERRRQSAAQKLAEKNFSAWEKRRSGAPSSGNDLRRDT